MKPDGPRRGPASAFARDRADPAGPVFPDARGVPARSVRAPDGGVNPDFRFAQILIMRLSMPLTAGLLAAACTLVSCGDPVDPEAYSATITFLQPAEGAVYGAGDTAHVRVRFEREGTLHNVRLTVTRQMDGTLVYDSGEDHVHADGSHEREADVVLETMHHGDFILEASTWDHGGEAQPVVATRTVHAHP